MPVDLLDLRDNHFARCEHLVQRIENILALGSLLSRFSTGSVLPLIPLMNAE